MADRNAAYKVSLVGAKRSATTFAAILLLTIFEAFATASAQPADIYAIQKAVLDYYDRGNLPAAQIEAEKLEQSVKAQFGVNHEHYAVALLTLGRVYYAQAKYGEAEHLYKRAVALAGKKKMASYMAAALEHLALLYEIQGKY